MGFVSKKELDEKINNVKSISDMEEPDATWECPSCNNINPNTTYGCKECGYKLI